MAKTTDEEVVEVVNQKSVASAKNIGSEIGVSRQGIRQRCESLVEDGELVRVDLGRDIAYITASDEEDNDRDSLELTAREVDDFSFDVSGTNRDLSIQIRGSSDGYELDFDLKQAEKRKQCTVEFNFSEQDQQEDQPSIESDETMESQLEPEDGELEPGDEIETAAPAEVPPSTGEPEHEPEEEPMEHEPEEEPIEHEPETHQKPVDTETERTETEHTETEHTQTEHTQTEHTQTEHTQTEHTQTEEVDTQQDTDSEDRVEFESLTAIGETGAENLRDEGIVTRQDVAEASDDEILSVPWVGTRALASIREHVDAHQMVQEQ